MGNGKGKGKGKGRAACQLVDTIDMWDFGIGSLRMSCFGVQKGAAGVLELGFGVDWRGGVPHVDVPQARVLLVSSRPVARIWRRQCWRTDIAVGQRGRELKGQREEKSYAGRIKDVAVAASSLQLALWNRVLKSSPRCKPNVQTANA